MAKMWAGRSDGVTDSIADDFNSSIRFDCKMYRQDIQGSMAHAAMLGAKNIISQTDADTLIDGLQGILDDLDSGALPFDMTCEDIHMFVEQVLTERLGDVGKKLHTARSRNDQVALDLRMYLREETETIIAQLSGLLDAVTEQAEKNKAAIMPGYTHLQRAQPILFSHQLLAYAMMLLRDIDRLRDCKGRINVSPIGSCALAGTTYDTDRVFEAKALGFDDIARNSIRLHGEWKGKIEVVSTVPVSTKDDLSLAYTPGVAQPCLEIQKDIEKSYELTRRHNLCAVITDGSAVLGNIGPEAGMPVMEGNFILTESANHVFFFVSAQ